MDFFLLFILFLGLGVVTLSSKKNSAGVIESICLSFLLGVFFITIVMFVLEIVGIKITYISTLISNILLISVPFIFRSKIIIGNLKRLVDGIKFHRLISIVKSTNLLHKLLTLVLFFLVIFNFARTTYWPPSAYDNITGYDLMAKVLAAEGTFNNSLFDANGVPIDGSAKRLVYPPLVAGSFGLAYLSGKETSKIVTALFTLFFVLLFYVVLIRIIPKTLSMFLTILMFITPTFFSFSMLSSTNVIFAIYISLGIIYLFYWFSIKENWMLVIASLFFGAASWTRSEAIVVVGAIFLVMLFAFNFRKNYSKIFAFIIPSILLFLCWNIFVETNYSVEQNVFHKTLFIDFEKLLELTKLVFHILTATRMFGIVFYLLPLTLIISIPYFKRENRFRVLTYLLFISFFAYTFIYYQMDNKEMSNLAIMISASYKRGILAFVPVIFFYFGSSPLIQKFGQKLEEKLSPSNIDSK